MKTKIFIFLYLLLSSSCFAATNLNFRALVPQLKTMDEINDYHNSAIKKLQNYQLQIVNTSQIPPSQLEETTKQGIEQLETLFSSIAQPLEKTTNLLSQKVTDAENKINKLLSPDKAFYGGAIGLGKKSLKESMATLITKAITRVNDLASAASNGEIKRGTVPLVTPGAFTKNPLPTLKTPVARKSCILPNEIRFSIRSLCLPYNNDDLSGKTIFAKTATELQELETTIKTGRKKAGIAKKALLFGDDAFVSKKLNTTEVLKAYDNSIAQVRSIIIAQTNTYYNELVDAITKQYKAFQDSLTPGALKKIFSNSENLPKDAFDNAKKSFISQADEIVKQSYIDLDQAAKSTNATNNVYPDGSGVDNGDGDNYDPAYGEYYEGDEDDSEDQYE